MKLNLIDAVTIGNIILAMEYERFNYGFKTRPFYEEVVRRFNEEKEKYCPKK